MIIFIFMNFTVALSAFFMSYKILRMDGLVDCSLSFLILFFAQVVATELLLGIFGRLYLNNIILLNLLLFLTVLIIGRNRKPRFDFKGVKLVYSELSADKIVSWLTCIILGFGLTKVFINLVNPPFGWDSLNYHFVFPVEWLKHGNLDNPITISDDPSPPYYPINGSLLFFWLMLPLKSVFLADLGQVPFFAMAFLAVFGISRKAGLKSRMAFYVSSLFILIPNFFKQLSIAYVDVMVAALFLVCLNFLFSLKERFSRESVLVFSLSLGLLLGTKTIALPYAVLLLMPFAYLICKNKTRFSLPAIAVPCIVILGGFSYIRNFFVTGNPLYPFNLRFFDHVFLRGVMDNAVYGAHFKAQDYSLAKLLFHEGLGIQSVIFVLPAIVLSLPAVFIKKKSDLSFNFLFLLILSVFIYLIYRWVIPMPNTRYLYPFLGVAMITAFYAAKILSIPGIIINVLVVICSFSSMSELAKRQELIVSIIGTVSLFLLWPFLTKNARFLKKTLFIVMFFILVVFSLALLKKDYVKNEYKRYIKMVKYSGFWPDAVRAWDWLNNNIPAGANIAYVGRPVAFPLYGKDFRNSVYYVSVNKTEPARLHYFRNSSYCWGYDFLSLHENLEKQGNYRGGANYSVWLENLLKRNTDFLFVYSLHQTKEVMFSMEDKWAKDNPDRFFGVFSNDTIHIYKVLR